MCQVIFQEKKEEIRHIGAKHGFIDEILLEKNIKHRRIRMDKPSITDGATCETPVNYSLKCEVSKCTIKIYIYRINCKFNFKNSSPIFTYRRASVHKHDMN